MALHIWFWILMLLLLLGVGYGAYIRNWFYGGGSLIVFLLFLVIGIKVFGSPFQG